MPASWLCPVVSRSHAASLVRRAVEQWLRLANLIFHSRIMSLLVSSDNWIDTTLYVMYKTEMDMKSRAKVVLSTYPHWEFLKLLRKQRSSCNGKAYSVPVSEVWNKFLLWFFVVLGWLGEDLFVCFFCVWFCVVFVCFFFFVVSSFKLKFLSDSLTHTHIWGRKR